MDWTEIVVKIPVEKLDMAENVAHMVVPYGIYVEDYSNLEAETKLIAHIDLIDDELLKKDRRMALIHIYIKPSDNPQEAISFLAERLDALGINHEIVSLDCNMEDYLNNWKKYFKPTNIGEKLLICPSWETASNPENRTILKIDPGLAFGTGTHETTRLCLELLEKYVSSDKIVLDVGCGSGILSIAALLLGAKAATGVDIDELAIKTAKENACVNNVKECFSGICGNLTDKINSKFDVIVANIVADVLIDLNPKIASYMNDNAVYIISGIIDSREDDVVTSLKDNFKIIDRREENGWVALTLSKA